MRERLDRRLSALRAGGRKALAVFLTAGFPDRDSTPALARTLAGAGVDIIEIGMPFSDPLADGPVIQQTSAAALLNGMTLPLLLDAVREIRRGNDLPLVLMGYLNPILQYGVEEFFQDAAAAGVDGIILPEVPLEEAGRFSGFLRSAGLAQILLVAPGTSMARVAAIDAASTGFLYCVSMTGVTGGSVERNGQGAEAKEFVRSVRETVTRNSVLAGFGISTPEQARLIAAAGDGVIIGSAFLRHLIGGSSHEQLKEWASRFREALDARAVHTGGGAV
jgi:tryptophan synthase alpha chain